MHTLPSFIVACVSPDGYQTSRNVAQDRLPTLRGRARYRLKDTGPALTVNVTLRLTTSEFNQWQGFWNGPAQQGVAPFYMMVAANALPQLTPVRAMGAFTARQTGWDRWQVSLTVEVATGDIPEPLLCPVIFGGPIFDLAEDDIYGGPITDLADDILEPCAKVFE